MPVSGNLVLCSKHLACKVEAMSEQEIDKFFCLTGDPNHKTGKTYRCFTPHILVETCNVWSDDYKMNTEYLFRFFPDNPPTDPKAVRIIQKKLALYQKMQQENPADGGPVITGVAFRNFTKKETGEDEILYQFRIIRNLLKIVGLIKTEEKNKLGGNYRFSEKKSEQLA